MAYVLFAPFPWVIERLIDGLVIPDTLMWYLLLASAVWGIWMFRARWRSFAHMLAFVVAIMGLFSLVEGNVGTLYRHRAVTVVAVVAVFAGPGLVAIARRLAARARGR